MVRVLIVVLMVLSLPAWSGERIYTSLFSSTAVDGYDVVSFYQDGGPVEGSKKLAVEYAGANWYFSSPENLTLFKGDPEKYIPQYGGHCAWAVGAKGERAPGDPEYWKVIEGKLYLNYNAKVQQKWLKDIQGFIEQGDKNWLSLLKD